MEKKGAGKVSSAVPAYPGNKGLSSKQSSGKTKHERMTVAPKVENLKGMPNVH